jgi:hypothetical protein
MSTQSYVTQYLQTLLFMILGVRAFVAWERGRDKRARNLAIATLLFAANSLLSAINATVFDASRGELPPRWDSILGAVFIYVSIYFFLRFLADFVTVPKWVMTLLAVLTVGNIVLAAIVRPEFRFDPKKGLVDIPGVSNPIDYRTYIGYVLLYLAVAFGVLFLAFLVYGLRVHSLARFRMLSISAGFFLLFVAVGFLPRLLFGDPSAKTIADLLVVVRYLALGSAPLLLLGFAPPKWVTRRFSGTTA